MYNMYKYIYIAIAFFGFIFTYVRCIFENNTTNDCAKATFKHNKCEVKQHQPLIERKRNKLI